MKKLKNFIGFALLVTITSVGFVGCGEDEKPKSRQGVQPDLDTKSRSLKGLQVLDAEGQPVVGAQILIGPRQKVPFEGNYGRTNDQGEFAIPPGWTQAEMVTIDAPGYLRATYMAQNPEPRRFILKKRFEAEAELGGVTSGHPVVQRDGLVDYALVMSAMTRQDLLNFQIQKVMSPVNDTISAVGREFPIPSNVSLPRQSESYFISITLDKPQYRLFFPQKGVQRVFAARGRFPLKPVVDGLRNDQEIFELINYFTITGGSIREVNLVENKTKLNIPVMDLTFKTKRAYKAPRLERGQILVALPVANNQGYLIPTDVKRLNSEQALSLAVMDDNPMLIAQVIKNQNEFSPDKPGLDRLSASLIPFEPNQPQVFLPLIGNPSVKSKLVYSIPEISSDLNRLTTYAVISDVKITQGANGRKIKTPTQIWEIYAPAWVNQMALPDWDWSKTAPTTRFEVSLVGSLNPVNSNLGPELMETATHVTRSSLDY